MAGIYIHIPFCRKACRYCDFHFTVSLHQKPELINAIVHELTYRRNEGKGEIFNTIYFGGGTPSLLSKNELEKLLWAVHENYSIADNAEISLEANPDDINESFLRTIKVLGFNRLSIGIQSFADSDLMLMRRSHSSQEGLESIRKSLEAGFGNISIDLIYGIPNQDQGTWDKNLEMAMNLRIQHLSAYHLTYEPGTVFDHWRKRNKLKPVSEDESLEQFQRLMNETKKYGFEHYEISNFALPGFRSLHNTSYWQQKNYFGFGPSAHSYNGNIRRWNISSNKKYMESILGNRDEYFDYEVLTNNNKYNEYLMTSLRTMEGVDLEEISQRFGINYVKYTENISSRFLTTGELFKQGTRLKLSPSGIFIADYIISEMFVDDQDEILKIT